MYPRIRPLVGTCPDNLLRWSVETIIGWESAALSTLLMFSFLAHSDV